MATTKKAVPKSAPAKKTANRTSPAHTRVDGLLDKVDRVAVRMYCLGTGDCFVLKFYAGRKQKFTMMIDCGSCRGDRKAFLPYIKNLIDYAGDVDLLVVTHEHNDHVNGFDKCADLFDKMTIREAWMAWTENPEDPDGIAQDLQNKRGHMRRSFRNALKKVEENKEVIQKELSDDYNNRAALAATTAFLDGLNTLGDINLGVAGQDEKSLPGMVKIKKMLEDKGVPTKYLYPGETLSFPELAGIRFYVLGPPLDKKYIYKNGKEGRDVYKRHFSIGEGILAMNAFAQLGSPPIERDLPFGREYVLDVDRLMPYDIDREEEPIRSYLRRSARLVERYREEKWRTIENEWLYAAGSLAIRLNSHINNTSLALAIEMGKEGDVILLPGDAEYGSWESWHMIEKWAGEGKNGKHLVEDLLNRTRFYKVSHHLSYNGTALEKGVLMMKHPELSVMATLDRDRIAQQWKSTMPNKELLRELITRSAGRCFIMSEAEIRNAPSKVLDPRSLGADNYCEGPDEQHPLYKQYVVRVSG